MELLLILLLFILIVATSGTHMYHVWKMKQYKVFIFQVGLIGASLFAAFLLIYNIQTPSFSELMNRLSPFK
jgi:hypothetical protein